MVILPENVFKKRKKRPKTYKMDEAVVTHNSELTHTPCACGLSVKRSYDCQQRIGAKKNKCACEGGFSSRPLRNTPIGQVSHRYEHLSLAEDIRGSGAGRGGGGIKKNLALPIAS